MSIKLDLTKFKHIKSDKNSSVLEHKDGHQLRVLHAPLAPESRAQLEALSKISKQDETNLQSDEDKHQSRSKMADGGKVAEKDHRIVMAPKMNQEIKPDKPVGNTLDYNQLKKEHQQKNKPHYAHGIDYVSKSDDDVYDPSMVPQQLTQSAESPTAIQSGYMANPSLNPLAPDVIKSPDAPQLSLQLSPSQQAQVYGEPSEPSVSSQDAPQQAQPANPMPKQGSTAAPQTANPSPTPQPTTQTTPQPKTLQDHAMDLHNEVSQTAQHMKDDIDNGHIAPKTYEDLFHYNKDGSEKSTLGKISTAFGMLLSGMGSGLAHQPNAMLNMMDKYIENDLSAQQKSTENKQNFLKINQADAANKANIGMTKEQTNAVHLDNMLKAYTQAQYAAQDKLTKQIDALPDNDPKKALGMQQLAIMNQGIQSGAGPFGSKLIAAGAAARMLVGQDQGQQSNPEAAFHHQQMGLRAMGSGQVADANEAHHLVGYSQPASGPIPQAARDQVLAHQKMEQSAAQLKDFVDKHGGAWDRMIPANRAIAAQMVLPIQAGFREGTLGTVYREGEQPLLDKAIHGQPLDLAQYFLQTEPKKLEQLRKTNSNQMNLTIKNLGIDPASAHQAPMKPAQNMSGQDQMAQAWLNSPAAQQNPQLAAKVRQRLGQ